MNIQEHQNLREYLTRFLLRVRKYAIVEDTEEFDVEVREDPLLADDVVEMLR